MDRFVSNGLPSVDVFTFKDYFKNTAEEATSVHVCMKSFITRPKSRAFTPFSGWHLPNASLYYILPFTSHSAFPVLFVHDV